MKHRTNLMLGSILLLAAAGVVGAATPPDTLHYQGVLRDAAGDPLDGARDMTFRFFDAETGGGEILVDDHLAAGTGAVTATDGLFSVALGGGSVSDGSGVGTYTSLSEMFRDFADVWVQIEIDPGTGFEVLSPRVQVRSAAYAHNATNLGGRAASGYLDTSAVTQTKPGRLEVSTMKLNGNLLEYAGGGRIVSSAGNVKVDLADLQAGQDLIVDGGDITLQNASISRSSSTLTVGAGGLNTDSLVLRAGNDSSDGEISIAGDSVMKLRSGNGSFNFIDGSSNNVRADIDAAGNLQIDGDLDVNGNDITFFQPGASITASSVELRLTAGDLDTDDLVLQAGNDSSDGSIAIAGDGAMELISGDGNFVFRRGTDSEITMTLSDVGNFHVDGDLDAGSGGITLAGPAGASLQGTATQLLIEGGDADTDDLLLRAGNDSSDGEISIFGDSLMRFRSGSGSFEWVNGTNSTVVGTLDGVGDFHVEGDVNVDGNDLTFGAPSAAVQVDAFSMTVQAGDAVTDDLFLKASASTLDGSIQIFGSSSFQMASGNGVFTFTDGTSGQVRATLDAAGNFQIDGQLEIDGPFIEGPDAANFEVQSRSSLHLVGDNEVRVMIDDTSTTTAATAEWFHDGGFNNASKLAELQEDGDLRIAGALSQFVAFDLAESFLASEPLAPGDVVRLDPASAGAVRRSTGADDGLVIGVVSERPGMLLGSAPFSREGLRDVWGDSVAAEFATERARLRGQVEADHPDIRARIAALDALEMPVVAETSEMPGEPGAPMSAPLALEDGAEPPSAERIARQRFEIEEHIESLSLERFFAERFVPVALAGRVPVSVDASFGAIVPGDALAAGPSPGIAMKADGSGPVIGTALEGLSSGRGKVLAFVHRGGAVPSPGAPVLVTPATGDAAAPGAPGTTTAPVTTAPDPATGTQTLPGHLQVVLDRGADDDARFSIFRDGAEDAALGAEVFRVDESGNVYARGSFRPDAMDLAEYFAVSGPVEPGDVIAVDLDAPGTPGTCRRAATAADRAVVGVVSEEPGVLLGSGLQRVASADPALAARLDEARLLGDTDEEARLWRELERAFARTHAPVALSGTVPVKVDAGYGSIRPGDLLTASPTPGHAMRADDPVPGTIVGKALEPLDAGTGRIRMLVMNR